MGSVYTTTHFTNMWDPVGVPSLDVCLLSLGGSRRQLSRASPPGLASIVSNCFEPHHAARHVSNACCCQTPTALHLGHSTVRAYAFLHGRYPVRPSCSVSATNIQLGRYLSTYPVHLYGLLAGWLGYLASSSLFCPRPFMFVVPSYLRYYTQQSTDSAHLLAQPNHSATWRQCVHICPIMLKHGTY